MKPESHYLKNLKLLKKSATQVPERPASTILETFDNRFAHRDYWVLFECPEFTALCPVTGQPDYDKICIHYIPDQQCIESKSLKHYLMAYRNFPTFQEEIVNRILEDVIRACSPREIMVIGHFNARGGISIEVKASAKK